MSMASRYNSTPLPAEVLVAGKTAEIVRARETYTDLMAHELETTPIEVGAVDAALAEATR